MVFATAAVLCLIAMAGCGGEAAPPDGRQSKVVIIALDGVSWNTAAPLMEQGRMPHLAALTRNGCWASLDTLKPTWTPIIFTTMATGKQPSAHGVDGFVDENGIPLSSNMRQVKALWNMASEAGRRVVFFGWPVTWPAEEVNGVLVAENFNLHENDRIHPAQLDPELAQRLSVLQQNSPDPEVQQLLKVVRKAIKDLGGAELKGGKKGQALPAAKEQQGRRRAKKQKRLKGLQLDQVLEYIRSRLRLEKEVSAPFFLELVAREEPDLAAVYFAGTDMLQHICGAREDAAQGAGVHPHPNMLTAINEVYTFYDRIIGELKNSITLLPGYEDCLFIVVSDHGFDLDIGDPSITLRYRRPVEDSPLFPATAVPPQNAADIYGPLPGYLTRTSLWGVEPTDPQVDLAQLSIFANIEPDGGGNGGWWRCQLNPELEGPARYHLLNRLIHYGQTGLEAQGVYTTTAHDFQPPGIFVVQGGPVENAGRLGDLSMAQITPTVLALLGLPAAKDMDGGPAALPLVSPGKGLVMLEAPSMVATYDSEPRTVDQLAVSSESDEKIRQQLRLMGYIE